MSKIAIRLLIIALVATVVIVFLLNKLLNKPSHLVDLVPGSAIAVVKVNTRDIAKDVYRYGGFTLDSMAFFNEDFPYFKSITDPRNTGINVYSELVLFQDSVSSGKYNCLLFNLNNPAVFKRFCSTNALLKMQNDLDTLYYSSTDSFYVWMNGAVASLIFNIKSDRQLEEVITRISKDSEEEKPFKKALKENSNIVIWQSQSNTLLERDLPYFGGLAEFYGDFEPGRFIFEGKTGKDVVAKTHQGLFLFPKIEADNSFKAEKEFKNKEIHPLAGALNTWRKNR